jgi:hypothetical protein
MKGSHQQYKKISFVYLRVISNQNHKAEKPATNSVDANEQNTLTTHIVLPASCDNTPATPPETTPLQTEPPMEVHHHSHTARKKWNHYLWEFLMLFLAVFCGFLAEYQLEHKIEKDREKQYMQSFIYDLQNDTTTINSGLPLKDERIKAIDSVFLFFESNPDVTRLPGRVFRYMYRTIWDKHYRRNSTTNDQLKNAGGMRLIRKKNVADSIAAYDLLWQRAEFWREAYTANLAKGKELLHKIFNAKELLSSYRNDSTASTLRANVTDHLTITIKQDYLNEYLNSLHDQKITTSQDKRAYQALEKTAERLISLVRKEYHLN